MSLKAKAFSYGNLELVDTLIDSIFNSCNRISWVSIALKVLEWTVFVKNGGNREVNCSCLEERQKDDWENWMISFSFNNLKIIGNEDRFYSGSCCILFGESISFTKLWIGFGVLCVRRNIDDFVDVTGVFLWAIFRRFVQSERAKNFGLMN